MSQFSGRLAGGRFSVFIIGPMGGDKDLPKISPSLKSLGRIFLGRRAARASLVPVSEHTRNIGYAARNVLRSLGMTDARFEVYVPDQLVSAVIKDDVFHRIDVADLAIADISTTSRNVMYEIAYFNALGTPLILIDFKGGTPPFYLVQSRVLQVSDYTIEDIAARLKPVIGGYLRGEDMNLTDNPITQFYGAALVDISAATGVAVGFFENFAYHVLVRGGVLSANPELTELVMIKPERINDLESDRRRVGARLAGGERRTLKAPPHPRGEVTALVIGDTIVDFPTPLYALNSAPRYRKLRDRINSMVADEARKEELKAKFEARIIESYFAMIRNLISDARNIAGRSWRIIDIREFEAGGLVGR